MKINKVVENITQAILLKHDDANIELIKPNVLRVTHKIKNKAVEYIVTIEMNA